MAFWISQENIVLNLCYLHLFLGKKEKRPVEGVVIYGGFSEGHSFLRRV